ncbi:SGNH/GDSL hydrolase family protein [Streptomyces sp. Li-HN-5-11]|uniref:SGNH/GDSL hydrolase family protein n=1 Tax=Streptomyces sp. Li-HN-5-11 TaxID=3075432 RepID=UPI0028AE2178|nr:SGNH/GDSL hydrolase family protein [Streptomyces sp. Li-HN-5-11]WNM31853.1 SGNH/GDSL hydrolase family protein [Streptomyces sp. Li-HN-5-11]
MEDDMANGLAGKTVYAFGDSIVYGHVYPRSFADLVAEQENMTLTKFARNGATIGADPHASGGQIRAQVEEATDIAPDFVLFDGGTNDAQSIFRDRAYDVGAYAEELEKTVHTMKRKWPTAHIVYVTAHKLGSRDWDTQLMLREVTLQACHRRDIAIADVFGDTTFDTRDDVQRAKYTFDDLVNGFPGTEGSGTHPNMAGITTFYVPVVSARLRQISQH